jgi:hypothetical protein
VHVRHDLSQITHVNEGTADAAIAEVLGPLPVIAVSSSVAWHFRHGSIRANASPIFAPTPRDLKQALAHAGVEPHRGDPKKPLGGSSDTNWQASRCTSMSSFLLQKAMSQFVHALLKFGIKFHECTFESK